jgi:glycosyltransferase involved in cell wall biosynthesis
MIPEAHFVLCGRGVTLDNSELVNWIASAGIQDHCRLLGERSDVASFFSTIDIATSSALSEAFPLSVGEAMACGTPCVVTDVGDSGLIVGSTGKVVAPRNPNALAEAWRELIAAGPGLRRHLGMIARCRVKEHFSLLAVVQRYQTIYEELAGETLQGIPCSDLVQRAG